MSSWPCHLVRAGTLSGCAIIWTKQFENRIGTNAQGTLAIGNNRYGIAVYDGASGNHIGPNNVISGNGVIGYPGVALWGAGTTENEIFENRIGTNADGTVRIGNNYQGVTVSDGASHNQIGPDNVISGNGLIGGSGIEIWGAGTMGNEVFENRIGTDAGGAVRIGNGFAGVAIHDGATSNHIGPNNVISGNGVIGGEGVAIFGTGTTGNDVFENRIGTDAQGTSALGNGYAGVSVYGGATDNLVGPDNIISGNGVIGGEGVAIFQAGTTNNRVFENRIGTNAGGTSSIGNAYAGVALYGGAFNNYIGPDNLISGNGTIGGEGVAMFQAGTTENHVFQNRIGTNAGGNLPIGNAYAGISVSGGASSNHIGPSNIISGNLFSGIYVADSGTTTTSIFGNLIGVAADGLTPIANLNGVSVQNLAADTVIGPSNTIGGNQYEGVLLDNRAQRTMLTGNAIGCDQLLSQRIPNGTHGVVVRGRSRLNVVGPDNTISGNIQSGIVVEGLGTNDNDIVNNLIGVAGDERTPLPNGASGVEIGDQAQRTEVFDGNVIGGNRGAGVLVRGTLTAGTRIGGNTIGLALDGSSGSPNGGSGILVTDSAGPVYIGVDSSESSAFFDPNTIASNRAHGVHVTNGAGGVFTRGNIITKNGGRSIALDSILQPVSAPWFKEPTTASLSGRALVPDTAIADLYFGPSDNDSTTSHLGQTSVSEYAFSGPLSAPPLGLVNKATVTTAQGTSEVGWLPPELWLAYMDVGRGDVPGKYDHSGFLFDFAPYGEFLQTAVWVDAAPDGGACVQPLGSTFAIFVQSNIEEPIEENLVIVKMDQPGIAAGCFDWLYRNPEWVMTS